MEPTEGFSRGLGVAWVAGNWSRASGKLSPQMRADGLPVQWLLGWVSPEYSTGRGRASDRWCLWSQAVGEMAQGRGRDTRYTHT